LGGGRRIPRDGTSEGHPFGGVDIPSLRRLREHRAGAYQRVFCGVNTYGRGPQAPGHAPAGLLPRGWSSAHPGNLPDLVLGIIDPRRFAAAMQLDRSAAWHPVEHVAAPPRPARGAGSRACGARGPRRVNGRPGPSVTFERGIFPRVSHPTRGAAAAPPLPGPVPELGWTSRRPPTATAQSLRGAGTLRSRATCRRHCYLHAPCT